MTTALQIAKAVAAKAAKLDGVSVYPTAPYGPRVRNAREAEEHGWMPDALATVTYEGGVDLIPLTLSGEFSLSGFYLEAYSNYMVGVYRVPVNLTPATFLDRFNAAVAQLRAEYESLTREQRTGKARSERIRRIRAEWGCYVMQRKLSLRALDISEADMRAFAYENEEMVALHNGRHIGLEAVAIRQTYTPPTSS